MNANDNFSNRVSGCSSSLNFLAFNILTHCSPFLNPVRYARTGILSQVKSSPPLGQQGEMLNKHTDARIWTCPGFHIVTDWLLNYVGLFLVEWMDTNRLLGLIIPGSFKSNSGGFA